MMHQGLFSQIERLGRQNMSSFQNDKTFYRFSADEVQGKRSELQVDHNHVLNPMDALNEVGPMRTQS